MRFLLQLSLPLIVFALAACGGSEPPAKDRVGDCATVYATAAGVSSAEATAFCKCMIDHVSAKYTDEELQDMHAVVRAESEKAQECRESAQGAAE